MKKLLLFLLSGLMIQITTTSCSESSFLDNGGTFQVADSLEFDIPSKSVDEGILSRIQAYNDSLLSCSQQTRIGFNLPFWVYADAAGAEAAYEITMSAGFFNIWIIGVAAGVASICEYTSYNTAVAERPSLDQILLSLDYSDNITIPTISTVPVPSHIRTTATSIGKKHNQILTALEPNNSSLIMTNVNEAISISENEYNLLEDFLEMEDVYDLYSMTPNPSSIAHTILSHFHTACSSRAQSPVLMNQIISDYSSMIAHSTELTEEEKDGLYIGMTVYAYSCNHWTNRLN